MNPVTHPVHPVGREDPVVRAAVESLRRRLKIVRQRFSQAAECGSDVEKVHQLRVATRRVSAALALFDELLPHKCAKKIARLQKRIRRAAGKVRDCDLVLARFAAQHDAPQFVARIHEAREKAYESLCRLHHKYVISGELRRRTKRLLRKTRRKEERSPDFGRQRFSQWCPARLEKRVDDLFVAAPTNIDDFSQLHRFRIRAKELRYALELVLPGLPQELGTEIYPEVEYVQTELGEINDESMILARLCEALSDDLQTSDLGGLRIQLTRAQDARDRKHRAFASWWTPKRCEHWKDRFARLIAAPG
jgi:CHAD domain-containing protein